MTADITDTIDTEDTFTTESSPGEQAFENTVDDTVAFVEAAIDAEETWYGTRIPRNLRGCIRPAFASNGSISPEPVPRRLAAIIDESGVAAGIGGGRHG